MADWREAKSLLRLLAQVNALAPGRDKSSDGTIGDARHAADPTSDHNPALIGRDKVVTALDVTNDPAHGMDSAVLAEQIRASRDPRIKYIISRRRIANPDIEDWAWRPYTRSNPHTMHCHISVRHSALADDERPWTIRAQLSEEQIMLGTASPDRPAHPVLRLGSSGDAVRLLQQRLGVRVDGYFGQQTEGAVRRVQSRAGLVADGVCGPYTWAAIGDGATALPVPAQPPGVFRDIVATVFGNPGDVEYSAYDNHRIGETELSVALPYRFTAVRPHVRVTNPANGKSAVASVEDVGPWNTNDPYFLRSDGRPQAETGRDHSGRRTNSAGIDLSPALARAIGIDGKGRVDFELVT